MKCCCCCAERTAWGSCGGRRVPRAASQDSFERTKYFGPVSGLGVASAVLDKARAEEASRAMSVACADGVPKRTGRLRHPLAVVSSASAGARIQEVRAACAVATHLWRYSISAAPPVFSAPAPPSMWPTSASTPMASTRMVGLRSTSTENVLSGDSWPGSGVGKAALTLARSLVGAATRASRISR